MSRLTAKEIEYLAELQAVLDRCPPRLGFFTIGDPSLTVYDRSKESQISAYYESHDSTDFCTCVDAAKAGFGVQLTFTAPVHSTSG